MADIKVAVIIGMLWEKENKVSNTNNSVIYNDNYKQHENSKMYMVMLRSTDPTKVVHLVMSH